MLRARPGPLPSHASCRPRIPPPVLRAFAYAPDRPFGCLLSAVWNPHSPPCPPPLCRKSAVRPPPPTRSVAAPCRAGSLTGPAVARARPASVAVRPLLLRRAFGSSGPAAPATPVPPLAGPAPPGVKAAPEALAASLGGDKIDISSALYDGPVPLPATSLLNQGANLFDFWQPVNTAIRVLEAYHDWSGLPWWLTIASMAVLMRTVLLPTNVVALLNSARMQRAKPELDLLAVQNSARQRGPGEGLHAMAENQARVRAIWDKHGVKYWKMLLPAMLSSPFFITFFLTMRRMALQEPEFADGGVLWFTDLSAPDAWARLPVASALLMAVSVEVGMDGQGGTRDKNKWVVLGMRAMVFFSIFFTMWFPQALHVYWITNTACSLLITLVSRLRPVRRWLDWPDAKLPPPGAKPVTAHAASSRPVPAAPAARGLKL